MIRHTTSKEKKFFNYRKLEHHTYGKKVVVKGFKDINLLNYTPIWFVGLSREPNILTFMIKSSFTKWSFYSSQANPKGLRAIIRPTLFLKAKYMV